MEDYGPEDFRAVLQRQTRQRHGQWEPRWFNSNLEACDCEPQDTEIYRNSRAGSDGMYIGRRCNHCGKTWHEWRGG